MFALAVFVAVAPFIVAIYAYVVYPAILWALVHTGRRTIIAGDRSDWPTITITVPVYNSVSSVRATLEGLLRLDFPKDRLQVVVLSDASNDGTDDIVREFADQGVELCRAPARRGKTAAENAAVAIARGEIIVNVDATVLVPPTSLKPLIRAFDDPTVGVASGRDLSVGAGKGHETAGESDYTNYEMLVRSLETRIGSIVGASGCFYGIRRRIRSSAPPLPPALSWDFASALVARQQGYRSVSVDRAICIVPRTGAARLELDRKVRTMARGLRTLFHFRSLMNPLRYGGFALMLISHKLFRWIPYLLAPFALLALIVVATQSGVATLMLILALLGLLAGSAGLGSRKPLFKPVSVTVFIVVALSAGFLAWWDAIRGSRLVTWEPTPRPGASAG